MKNFIIIFAIIIAISCNNNNNYVIVGEFPINDTINMTLVDVPPILLSPGNMFVLNDYLVVSQTKGDTLFSVFNIPDCTFAFNGGLKGKGPNEFNFLDPRYFVNCNDKFKVLDNGVTIKDVEIDKHQFVVSSKQTLSVKGGIANNIIDLERGKICVINTIDDLSEYWIIDTTLNQEIPVSHYPNWTNDVSQQKMFVYIKNCIAKPTGDRFISFYANFRKLRLHSSNGDLLKEVSVETPFKLTQYSENPYDRYITYASYPYADDQYIYIFCKNSKIGDYSQMTTELQVWNWDAEPVARIILDSKLSVFTISTKLKQLYACSLDVEDKIFVCELPQYLYDKK